MAIAHEQRIMSSGNDALTLTTHRLRYRTKRLGAAHFVSLMLDGIASASVAYRSYPILIVLALLSGGLTAAVPPRVVPLFVFGAIVLFVAFFLTRRLSLVFATAGESINVPLKNMSIDTAIDFVDAVEEARHAYTARP